MTIDNIVSSDQSRRSPGHPVRRTRKRTVEALPPAPFPALLHEWGIALTIAS